jgi:hypothetical protein
MTSAVLSILELRTVFSVKIAQSRPCAIQKAGWDATALEAVKNGSKPTGQAAKQYRIPYTIYMTV